MGDLISIIVPIYNVEAYLPECIESLINQSYKNIEIILVDDGSTDSCPKICDEYKTKDNRIIVIHRENGGLSAARNSGIERAKGRYFAFVDSDDYVHINYIDRLYSILNDYCADLVACSFISGEICVWKNEPINLDIRENHDALNRMNDNDVVVTVAWNKLYDARFFKELHLRFEEGKINEDMYMAPQVLSYTKKFVITNEKLYFYRIRKDSIMTSAFSEKKLQIFDALEFRLDFFERNNEVKLLNEELENYIRKSLAYNKILSGDNLFEIRKKLKSRTIKILRHHKALFKVSIKSKIKYLILLFR